MLRFTYWPYVTQSDPVFAKRERIYRRRYLTLDDARLDVFDYIERSHNPRMQRRVDHQERLFNDLNPTVRGNGVEPVLPSRRMSW